ncbi:Hypothetical predicted protein [Paramuricea clavata]|uniref:Uncharacterized protein n=1 Tax=Paramuricea clavata TaxID=317549 RepID=A0A7D9E660_PARCT|nr:Hypothetical predicted protein [Paramuricea clavata]
MVLAELRSFSLDDCDVEVNKALSTLLLQNIECKIGGREQLPGTQHRCRIVGYDTHEVCPEAACLIHYAEQGRQWLESRMRRLRQDGDEEQLLLDVNQYGRLPFSAFG